MRHMILALVTCFVLAPGTEAVTLTISPDKTVYQVGEEITLGVTGDSEGALETAIYGRILFDGNRADYVMSVQESVTSLGIPWALGSLVGGSGFADAFNQVCCFSDQPIDGLLGAVVVLRATSPGVLGLSWDLATLDFFDVHLSSPPGVSVTIVPEPVTALLLALGLACIARLNHRLLR